MVIDSVALRNEYTVPPTDAATCIKCAPVLNGHFTFPQMISHVNAPLLSKDLSNAASGYKFYPKWVRLAAIFVHIFHTWLFGLIQDEWHKNNRLITQLKCPSYWWLLIRYTSLISSIVLFACAQAFHIVLTPWTVMNNSRWCCLCNLWS